MPSRDLSAAAGQAGARKADELILTLSMKRLKALGCQERLGKDAKEAFVCQAARCGASARQWKICTPHDCWCFGLKNTLQGMSRSSMRQSCVLACLHCESGQIHESKSFSYH